MFKYLLSSHKMRSGLAAARKHQFEKAAKHLKQAAELAPESPLPRLHLARALAADAKWNEAEPVLKNAVELAGDAPAVIILAAVVYFDAGDFQSAETLFERALKLNPRNDLARAYRTLTRWCVTGDYGYAGQLRRQGIPDSPDFAARLILTIEENELKRKMEKSEKRCASDSLLAEILTGEQKYDIPMFRINKE